MLKTKESDYSVGVGKQQRFYCEDCSTDFIILHEPDYTEPAMRKAFGGEAKVVEGCPFCGSEDVNPPCRQVKKLTRPTKVARRHRK